MQRVLLKIGYDGTNYYGWQRQNNAPSVQELIEQKLFVVTGEKITIHASGRTDAGVHALCQVAHFDTNVSMPADRFAIALNMLLPGDIRVSESYAVKNDFHSRFCAKSKHYNYQMNISKVASPLRRNIELHVHLDLDETKMHLAAQSLIGEHDFTAFVSAHCPLENHIRTIYSSKVTRSGNIIKYDIVGSGFLRHMVRIIVGTLIDVGKNKKPVTIIQEAIEKKDRNIASATAPAHGLTLVSVNY